MSLRMSVAILGLFFAAAQILALRPDGWVTGDQGSKYLQTRAFATQGPLNPAIQVLARDIDPEYRHQEPKLKNRRGRLVSEFLWLLPLLSAPFFRTVGVYGLYVIPALSAIAIFLAAAALGRRLGDARGVRTAWVTLLVTPVVLYSLEFWEHAPAAACVMIAAVLMFPGSAAVPPRDEAAASRARLAVAGALLAIGSLFREEVIAALPALAIARAISVPQGRLKASIVAALWAGGGAALVLAASVPVNLMIYGAPLPMHMTQDAWEVAKSTPYMQVRREVLFDLLLPATHVGLFVTAAAAGLAAALAQRFRVRADPARADDGGSRGLLAVVHAAAIVMLVITVALPFWRVAQGAPPHDAYLVSSAAHTWVFAIAILYWPWFVTDAIRPTVRFLLAAALLMLAVSVIVIPTSGGSQWSPRFLLAVAPLLALIAAAALRSSSGSLSAAQRAARRADALPRDWQRVGRQAMAAAILLAAMAMQLTGVVWVYRSKVRTARLSAWVAARTAPGEVLISNVFWFPEIMSAHASTRRLLFSWHAQDMPEMAAMAVTHGFRKFRFITSPQLTGYTAPPSLDWPGAPCRFTRQPPLVLAELLISEYECGAP